MLYFLVSILYMIYLMYIANDYYIHEDKVDWNLFIIFSILLAPVILPIVFIVGVIFKIVSKRKQVKMRKIMENIVFKNSHDIYDFFYYLELIHRGYFVIQENIENFCDWVNYKFHHYTCRYKIQLEMLNCHEKNIKEKYNWLMQKPNSYQNYIIRTIVGYDKKSKEIFFGKDYSCYGGFFFRFTAERFAKKLRKELSSENIMVKNPYTDGNEDYASINVKVIVPEWVF